MKKIGLLLGPIIVGSAAGQLALFFDRFFASTLAPGYIAGMNYATKLVNFPQQIFAAAIATVIFPLLAAQFARENRRGVGAQRRHRAAAGQLHHDPVGLRADRARASDGAGALRARHVPGAAPPT